MNSRLVFVTTLLFMAGVPNVVAQGDLPPEVVAYPEWVLHNGVILTVDQDQPPIGTAQALAVRGDRILAVGTNDRIMRMVGPNTEVVDLQGKTVMPGVIDTHSHPNRYALSDYQEDIPAEIRQRMHPLEVDFDVETKEELIENIRNAVKDVPAEVDWLATAEPRQTQFTTAWRSLRKEDMDSITTERPLSAIWRTMGPVNSKAIEVLVNQFGNNMPGIKRDANGEPTGWIEGVAAWTVYTDMRPNLGAKYLASVYKKELEEWAAIGVTTLSTRLSGYEVSGYAKLARQEELPIRMAVSHDGVGRWNPMLKWYLGRLGNIQDFALNEDWMWFIGLSVGIPDAGPEGGLVASRAPKRNPLDTDTTGVNSILFWDSEGDPTPEDIKVASRYGYRVTGVHTFGDLGYESMMDAYGAAEAENNEIETMRGEDYPPYTMDHLMMVSPAVIEKMRQLTNSGQNKNLTLSVQTPMFFGRRSAVVRSVYGEDVFWNWLQPNRSMMNAGAILTYGADTGNDPDRQPMHSLQVITGRVNHEGTAIKPSESLTREEGLLMITRWGKYYVGRNDLGSLEAGNLADLLILDKNPLDPNVPGDQIKSIRVLMTMIDGNPAYLSPDLDY